jgi:hypothetical protein
MKRRYVMKHGLNGLMSRIKTEGMQAIDQRSAGARALQQWKAELVADLGGEEAISAQEMTILELAVRTKLFIDHIDLFLMEQQSLVNKKRRSLYPVVQQRNSLVNTLANLLSQLGLKRREKPEKSLAEYLEEKRNEHSGGDGGRAVICEDVPTEEVVAEQEAGD